MFLYDVETLSKKSSAVILSMACTHFDVEKKPSPQDLRDNTFFVKFDVQDQIKRLNRHTQKSTIDWWAKQCDDVKKASFFPSSDDVTFEVGHEAFRQWVKERDDGKEWVWARGSLDQMVLDDMEEELELVPVFEYYRWRDVRTAVDFLYGTTNGYCDVEYQGFDPFLHITKHNPIDDCVYDSMMLMYGASK